MNSRTVTRSIESDLNPNAIFKVLADPKRIPEWAPVFADTIVPVSQNAYRVTKGGDSFRMEVAASPSAGTVDYVRDMGPGKRGGAYCRVFPGPGDGSVVFMTVPLAPASEPQDVASILEQELSALVRLSAL